MSSGSRRTEGVHLKIEDIAVTVARRMRDAAKVGRLDLERRQLFAFGIDGTMIDDATGCMIFKFANEKRLNVVSKDNETGQTTSANIPIDGFILDPKQDWELISWYLERPPPN